MYLDNKYTRWYYNIIEAAKARGSGGFYTENHHIIPKSLGGSNDKINMVRLTAREHYVVHCLLVRMLRGVAKYKMISACWRMTTSNDIRVTSRQFQTIKELHSALQSVLQKRLKKEQWADPNSVYNSKEYGESLSQAIKDVWKDPNSIYNTPEYRENKSKATKEYFAIPGMKEKQSEKTKEALNRPGMKEKLSEIQIEVQNRPERKEVQSKAIKSLWDDPNSFYNSKQYSEMVSVQQKEVQNRPEVKAKIFEKNAKVFQVTNPAGESFIIKGLSKFCRENGLHAGNMSWLAKGKLKYYKGWSCFEVK
jgi:hypothetical protein